MWSPNINLSVWLCCLFCIISIKIKTRSFLNNNVTKIKLNLCFYSEERTCHVRNFNLLIYEQEFIKLKSNMSFYKNHIETAVFSENSIVQTCYWLPLYHLWNLYSWLCTGKWVVQIEINFKRFSLPCNCSASSFNLVHQRFTNRESFEMFGYGINTGFI